MAEKSNTDSNKKKAPVMDVSHPGTSAPNPTSRPIITGSGTMLRDPMFRDSDGQKQDDKDGVDVEETKAPSTSNRVILPLSKKEDERGNDDDGDAKQEQANESIEPSGEETIAEQSRTGADAEGSAIINAVIDTSAGGKNTTKQVVDDDAARIDEIIKSKKYFVKTSGSGSSLLLSVVVIGGLLVTIILFFYYANLQDWITLPLG